MCRLAMFPPHFPRDKALEILLEFEGGNTDGCGSTYVNAAGEFVVNKRPKSLSKIMDDGEPFLEHMDGEGHDGWTIAHLRAKSHGEVAQKNTHPFIIDDKWAFCHNGVWTEYNLVKLALSKTVKFEGETDTEVAGHLLNIAGPKAFTETVSMSGVFLALRKDGNLYVCKTSGSLNFCELENGTVLGASALEYKEYPKRDIISDNGWFYFGKNGKLIQNKKKEFVTKWSSNTGITMYGPGRSDYEYMGE